MEKQFKDLHDQSLAMTVEMQPFQDALLSFWKEILLNENSRPYHKYRNFTGLRFCFRLILPVKGAVALGYKS